jgi:hypothetical protein
MTTYAVDWSHDEKLSREDKKKKSRFYNGKKFVKTMPVVEEGDIFIGENLPDEMTRKICEAGGQIYYCSTHQCKEWRDKFQEIDPTGDYQKSIKNPQDDLDTLILWALYHEKPETFYRYYYDPRFADLKMAVAARKRAQRMWNALHNQVFATESELMKKYEGEAKKMEVEIDKSIAKLLKQFPIYTEYLQHVAGIDAKTAAQLIAYTRDIRRFPTFSKLCSYFGLSVVNGSAPRKEKGKVASWHQAGRALLLGIIADSFVKQTGKSPIDSKTGNPKTKKDGTVITRKRSKYRDLYDQFKEQEVKKIWTGETIKNKKLVQGQPVPGWLSESRTRRKMVKAFLEEFYDKSWEVADEQFPLNMSITEEDREVLGE